MRRAAAALVQSWWLDPAATEELPERAAATTGLFDPCGQPGEPCAGIGDTLMTRGHSRPELTAPNGYLG